MTFANRVAVLRLAADPHLHELHARHRDRRLVGRVHGRRIGDLDLEQERGRRAHHLELVDVSVRHLNEEPFAGDERIHAIDREADLSALHDPPDRVVRLELTPCLLAGRHLHVVGDEQGVAHDRFAPGGLAGVRREQIGQPGVRLVGRDPFGGCFRHRRPDQRFLLRCLAVQMQRERQQRCCRQRDDGCHRTHAVAPFRFKTRPRGPHRLAGPRPCQSVKRGARAKRRATVRSSCRGIRDAVRRLPRSANVGSSVSHDNVCDRCEPTVYKKRIPRGRVGDTPKPKATAGK